MRVVADGVQVTTSFLGGAVGIGTTSPQRQLHVYRSDDGAPVRFEDSNGYCEIDPTSTTWTCTSDERLKRDITSLDARDMVERIASLNPVTYRWNNQNDDTLRLDLCATSRNGLS